MENIIDCDVNCLTCLHCDWSGWDHMCSLFCDENGDPSICPKNLICDYWEGDEQNG
ncbi:MAG: hypothetical protein MJ170_02860 [Alphaproteobacteria bacterium]|nr:hypothetical protein [Alphaproteobacteria bacterium]